MCGFYCVAFIEYIPAEKTLLDYTNSISLKHYKKNGKIIYNYLRKNMSNLEFILKKVDKARNYLVDKINHNDLMRQKYKKTCKYLNYVELFLILVSIVTGCVSISGFASLVCASAVGM